MLVWPQLFEFQGAVLMEWCYFFHLTLVENYFIITYLVPYLVNKNVRIKVKICFSLFSNMHTKRCYLNLCKTHVFISRGSNPKIINWNCILYKVDIVCTQFIYCLQQSIFGLLCMWIFHMSPKLVRTYPHIVENLGITRAPLILRLISWKSLPNQLKSLSNLTFSLMFWLFLSTLQHYCCLVLLSFYRSQNVLGCFDRKIHTTAKLGI